MARPKEYLAFIEELSDHDLLAHHGMLVRRIYFTKEDVDAIWAQLRTKLTIEWNERTLTQQDYVQVAQQVDDLTEQLKLCEEELESRGRFAIERPASTSQDPAQSHTVGKTTGEMISLQKLNMPRKLLQTKNKVPKANLPRSSETEKA